MQKIIKGDLEVLVGQIIDLVEQGRKNILRSVNTTMVSTYFNIGNIIVEHEQNGESRAKYSESTMKVVASKLTNVFGKGYSHDNLQNMRNFYLTYKKYETVSRISQGRLSWSHFVTLVKVENDKERNFYEKETLLNNWSVRELSRQINTSFYERSLSNQNKNLPKSGPDKEKTEQIIKDPFILEFLGLNEDTSFTEKDLELKIINNLQKFLLELGKGFAFVSRQQRISFGNSHFYIDLVFYNSILKCFVLIDLKIGEVKHQDLGQIQMHVNYYDRVVKEDIDNKTIGLVLCKEKNNTMVNYTLPEDNAQIFASKYKTCLPSKEELEKYLDSDY